MHEGGYPSWSDARRRVQDKTVGARDHLAKRPDDPGVSEERDDLSEARAIFGWLLLVLALVGVALVYFLA
jgi:hypothetical protein